MNKGKLLSSIVTLFFSMMATNMVYAQFPKDPETGEIRYSDVVELKELNKESIYNKAKLWIVSTLKSGDNMVELSGSNLDQIVGTGNVSLDSVKLYVKSDVYSQDANLNFKFLVFCKDGRFKYSVENFTLTYKDVMLADYVKTGLVNIKHPNQVPRSKREAYQKMTESYLNRVIVRLIDNFLYSMKKENEENW